MPFQTCIHEGDFVKEALLRGDKHDALQPMCMCLKAYITGRCTKWGLAEIAVLTRLLRHCRLQIHVMAKFGALYEYGALLALHVYGALPTV